MADSKDERQANVHRLPSGRRQENARPLAENSPDADQGSADPLLDALHRLEEDILDEPVPERLRDALRKKPSGKK